MQKRHGLCKNMRGNKKEQVPVTSKKKKKSETRGKNGQVSGVELGAQRCPPERKKMDKCLTIDLGVFTTHLKKERDSPCSSKAKIKRRRDSNTRSNEK